MAHAVRDRRRAAGEASLPEAAFLSRRRLLLVAAAVIAAWLPFDLMRPQGARLAFATRLFWAFAVLGAALLQRRPWPRASLRATQGAAVASALASVLLVWSQDGARGPFFGFLVALPLAMLGFVPSRSSTAILVGAITTAAGIAMNVEAGVPTAVTVEWFAIAIALMSLGVTGTIGNRRLLEGQVRLEREKAKAEQDLAESERRRSRSERLAAVGQLASGLAHEVNNPLSYVKASLSSLRDSTLPEDERREALQEAMFGVDRIAQIVADLRAFGRDMPEEAEDCPVGEVVEEALRIASARTAGAHVTCQIEPGPMEVRAVRRWLVQSVVNLLTNACDAVEGVEPERRWIRVELGRSGSEVRLVVEDGGRGIAAEVAPKLFQVFFSTKGEKGTGLGLALTRDQVERSGGHIEVGRAAGGGARFEIRLPALVRVAPPVVKAAGRPDPPTPEVSGPGRARAHRPAP